LDILLARPPREPENLVIVTFGHEANFQSSLGCAHAFTRLRAKNKTLALPAQRTSPGRPRACMLHTPPSQVLCRLLLVVLYFLKVGVNDVIAAAALALWTRFAGAGLRAAVDGLAELQGSLRQGAGLGLDVIYVVGLGRRLEAGDRALDRALVGSRYLVA